MKENLRPLVIVPIIDHDILKMFTLTPHSEQLEAQTLDKFVREYVASKESDFLRTDIAVTF